MVINSRKVVFTVIICFIFSISFLQQPVISSSALSSNEFAVDVGLTIQDAYYGDFDEDNYTDDIQILLSIDIVIEYDDDFDEEIIFAILYTEISLPSGLNYEFKLQFSTEYDDEAIFILITALNTANEPGWYKTEIKSNIIFNKNVYTPSDSFIFDPPTGGVPGADPLFSLSLL